MEGLRQLWMQDIYRIGRPKRLDLQEWINREDFLFGNISGPDQFAIQALDPKGAMEALAFGCNKMASAAFETMIGIGSVPSLPKSVGWIVIRSYYAAFFAAHSLLRVFGTACVQLDSVQTASLDHVADTFGMLPAKGFRRGLYVARFEPNFGRLEIHFQKASERGSHVCLWESFADHLRRASNVLLSLSAGFNEVSSHLCELEDVLRRDNQTGGGWLSYFRNRINYRQESGVWFPYSASTSNGAELSKIVQRWPSSPESFFPLNTSEPVVLHVWTCTLIVSICHAVALDIEMHHQPRHKCFHSHGSLALTRLEKVAIKQG